MSTAGAQRIFRLADPMLSGTFSETRAMCTMWPLRSFHPPISVVEVMWNIQTP